MLTIVPRWLLVAAAVVVAAAAAAAAAASIAAQLSRQTRADHHCTVVPH